MKFLNFKTFFAFNILTLGILSQVLKVASRSLNASPIADTVSVKQFGAKGDGIQNDSAAFETAIKFASQHKQVLLVPKGTYGISDLLVYPNCTMVGNDSNTVLRLTNGARSNRQCLLLTGISQHVQLKNIRFDANSEHNSGKNIFCVKTTLNQKETVNDLLIQNCWFTGSKDYGALFLIGATDHITNVKIRHCKFYNTGSCAVSIRGINGLVFNNNSVYDWSQLDKSHPAFSFQSEQCSNIVFEHNYFKNKNAAYFAVEVAGTRLINGRFIGNTFDGNGYDASGISGMYTNCRFENNKHLNGGGSHRSGYELVGDYDTISNNIIQGGAISLGAGEPGLAFSKGGSAYIVTGNKVSSNTGVNNVCLAIGGLDTVKNALIENNVFDNSGGKGNAPAIHIGQRGPAMNVTIQNNQIYGPAKNVCIRLKVLTGSAFSGNIVIRKNVMNGEDGIEVSNMRAWKGIKVSENDFKHISGSVFRKSEDFTPDFHIDKNIMH